MPALIDRALFNLIQSIVTMRGSNIALNAGSQSSSDGILIYRRSVSLG